MATDGEDERMARLEATINDLAYRLDLMEATILGCVPSALRTLSKLDKRFGRRTKRNNLNG